MIVNSLSITYLFFSLLSVVLAISAASVGVLTARKWNPAGSAEQQHELEKRVYLVITLAIVGFSVRLVTIPLWFGTLWSFLPSLPGAMCLIGPHLAAGPTSFIATLFKFLLPLGYIFWLILNRIDRSLETQPFMKFRLYLLVPIGALIALETIVDLKCLAGLVPRQVSCCSSLFDIPSPGASQLIAGTTWFWTALFCALTVLNVGLTLLHRRRLFQISVVPTYLLPLLAALAFVFALHTEVGPSLLGTPLHHCVFCLWQRTLDAPIFTSLIVLGLWLSVCYAWLTSLARRRGLLAEITQPLLRLSSWSLWCTLLGSGIMGLHLLLVTLRPIW